LPRRSIAIDYIFPAAFRRGQMKRFLIAGALAFLTNTFAHAGVEPPVQATVAPEPANPFAKGAKEFQDVSGAFFYYETFRDNPPAIDFAVQSIGWESC